MDNLIRYTTRSAMRLKIKGQVAPRPLHQSINLLRRGGAARDVDGHGHRRQASGLLQRFTSIRDRECNGDWISSRLEGKTAELQSDERAA